MHLTQVHLTFVNLLNNWSALAAETSTQSWVNQRSDGYAVGLLPNLIVANGGALVQGGDPGG